MQPELDQMDCSTAVAAEQVPATEIETSKGSAAVALALAIGTAKTFGSSPLRPRTRF